MKAPVTSEEHETKLGIIESSASLNEPHYISGKIVSKQVAPDRSHSISKTFKLVDTINPDHMKLLGQDPINQHQLINLKSLDNMQA